MCCWLTQKRNTKTNSIKHHKLTGTHTSHITRSTHSQRDHRELRVCAHNEHAHRQAARTSGEAGFCEYLRSITITG
eukprot:m.66599 g.66599  ORF g.66599 m.66599 type:complete len:76 (+) comp12126_c1_seq1:2707-2934(+)